MNKPVSNQKPMKIQVKGVVFPLKTYGLEGANNKLRTEIVRCNPLRIPVSAHSLSIMDWLLSFHALQSGKLVEQRSLCGAECPSRRLQWELDAACGGEGPGPGQRQVQKGSEGRFLEQVHGSSLCQARGRFCLLLKVANLILMNLVRGPNRE